jgi:hypothetical protein
MNKSVAVSLANGSPILWRRVNASLSQGTWSDEPPEAIPAFVGVRWINQTGDFDSAVGGSVTYEGSKLEGRLKISWSNPFIGELSVTVEVPPAISEAHEIETPGDNATIGVVIAQVTRM